MTKREQILGEILSLLDGLEVGSDEIAAERSRVTPVSREDSPRILIHPLADSPADDSPVGVINWEMLVRITVVVRGAVPDTVADPIIAKIHETLMQNRTLGDLSMDIGVRPVTFNFENTDQPAGVFELQYSIKYRTTTDQLT